MVQELSKRDRDMREQTLLEKNAPGEFMQGCANIQFVKKKNKSNRVKHNFNEECLQYVPTFQPAGRGEECSPGRAAASCEQCSPALDGEPLKIPESPWQAPEAQ